MSFKKALLCLVAFLFCVVVVADGRGSRFTLVIDAGHGGEDIGAPGKKTNEKKINLAVALAFGRYVEQNCSDVRVIYTRKTDVFIPLHERAAIANRNKADVFISIHTNSLASKKPIRGLETYTMGIRRSDEKLSAAQRENAVILIEKDYEQHYAGYDPRSPESSIMFELINETIMAQSVELAQLIQEHVCSTARRPNKGVKQDAFLVLRETSMPACLVELGYISTPDEETYLCNSKNVDAMGLGLYQAFVAFKKSQTGKGSTAPDAQPKQEEKKREQPRKEQPRAEQPAKDTTEGQQAADAADAPVFKVQFLVSNRRLAPGSSQLKGLKDADCYQEGNLYKYTVGASTDYNAVYRQRKQILKKFPQAFIIAFRNGQKMDAAAAYQEYKRKQKK